MTRRYRRNKSKTGIPSKYILFGLTLVCLIAAFLSLNLNLKGGPLKIAAEYVFVPMQKGINEIGLFLTDKMDDLKTLQKVQKENLTLKSQVDQLTTENSTLKLEQYELDNLRELYKLDQKYPSYDKVAARVIGKDMGNWFDSFLIDKGSKDGIEVDMNVIAGSGLVGIVTDVGKHSATVRAIIDDTSDFGGMILSTSDSCIVSGDLKSMNEDQVIRFSMLKDNKDMAAVGDQVVTSHISDKYLQGILVGYITSISKDSNNLTKSGTITPVVDFEHLEEVLVILEKKEIE
ncbi:MAG: rod shape-determining protein MreC [Lachnospiraceae bacterium]